MDCLQNPRNMSSGQPARDVAGAVMPADCLDVFLSMSLRGGNLVHVAVELLMNEADQPVESASVCC